jgi:nicotinate-nucleotide--dimethylbenzimidazole phosphoribosyltransferase
MRRSSALSTELIKRTIASIPSELSPQIAEAAQQRWDSLTKPRGSLGRLESEVSRLAQIQNTAMPHVQRPQMYIFCGDHGITAENVSPYPSVVTREMVRNFVRGGAAINVLCRNLGIETIVIDAGVCGPKIPGVWDRRIAEGTRNFLREPAMSEAQATESVETGIALARQAAEQADIAGVGEMGIGNSTAASALLCALARVAPEEAAGRGAGLDDSGLEHKRAVIAAALARHRRQVEERDPLNILAVFGGFEIAVISGFLLGAAAHRLPTVVDGFIAGAAFLVAQAFYPEIGRHVFFSHRSAELGHAPLLRIAGASPLLDLNMRLGEGTGAALAISVLRAGVQLYREMATFAEASISEKTTAH